MARYLSALLVAVAWTVVGLMADQWGGQLAMMQVSIVFALLAAAEFGAWRHMRWLERLSRLDELTGAHNFRYLREQLPREIARAERRGESLSILMLDLRDFKRYNDRHGHMVGNHALKDVARIIREAVRAGDTVVRFGGDEFAAILPGADRAEALCIGERLGERIAQHFGDLQADVGVHTYVEGGPEHFLHVADMAMYARKQNA